MRHALLLLLICLPVCWAQSTEPIGPELLTNGSMEALDPASGMPQGWVGSFSADWGDCAGNASASQEAPHEGKSCLLVTGVRGTYMAGATEVPSLDPQRSYVLTGWLRTSLARGQSTYLTVSWRNKEGRFLSLQTGRRLAGKTPWKYVELPLTVVERPAGAVQAHLSVRVTGTGDTGQVWADQLSLRECRALPGEAVNSQERRRLLEMARELLIEVQVWRDRLATLQQRRADLEALSQATEGFDSLVTRYGAAVRSHSFLTRQSRPREDLERAVATTPAEIVAQVDKLQQLADLRNRCFGELGRMLDVKRKLDASEDLRRFYLWAQLAGLRGETEPGTPSAIPVANYPLLAPGLTPSTPGELGDVTVRVSVDRRSGTGTLRLTSELLADKPATLQLGLFDPAGRLVAATSRPVSGGRLEATLQVRPVDLWFPDYPYLYTLRAALVADGKLVDLAQQRVAFREVTVAECDVNATMRHAWDWALTDYTFAINGQPYFLRGTVVSGETRRYPQEASALFSELWLDFQRTYGAYLAGVSPEEADQMADLGLTLFGSIAPSYTALRHYVSSTEGLEDFRDLCHRAAWIADHPAVVAMQTGNEAELSVWGADLPSVYGDDLWHCFNEVNKVVRDEMKPQVPMGYVRATNLDPVLSVPRDDYSGVNQYTGRYFGRRCTMTSDLETLALGCTLDSKPMGITEWNGPKYSWATRGVSGVDEEGAAQYIFDYYRTMTRTPATLFSTEFVMSWVVTPLEDLTTTSLTEGMKRRGQWKWNLQQGVPWYPDIWPNLLTNTAARRTMAGFGSPLLELCESPGEVLVASHRAAPADAAALTAVLRGLGKDAKQAAMPSATELARLKANLVLIGGTGDDQPEAIRALERLGVIGATSAQYPAAGRFLLQRRINPYFPDRFLVTVTAADAQGLRAALDKLTSSAQGLREAYGRQASCRRALALVDDRDTVARAFARYVMELPTRSTFVGRDDVRTSLRPEEILRADRTLADAYTDLGAVIVAVKRPLTDAEASLLLRLPEAGVNVIWSGATLGANPEQAKALGVSVSGDEPLTDSYRVSDWAQTPLSVPEMGDLAADRLERFGALKPSTPAWKSATTTGIISATDPAWRSAVADSQGRAVVMARDAGRGSHWVFGADLSATAEALVKTTTSGVLHSIYDRDTACGLERLFRVVANAASYRAETRPADRPRLRAAVECDRSVYQWGDQARVTVRVKGADGLPTDASVRVSFARGDRLLGLPGPNALWVQARRVAPGCYEATTKLSQEQAPGGAVTDTVAMRHRGETALTAFADVSKPGCVADWTSEVVRVTDTTNEAAHLVRLGQLLRDDAFEVLLSVNDTKTWVEIAGALTVPAQPRVGQPSACELVINRVENDEGNDWMEDVELVLTPEEGGEPILVPLAPGKVLASTKASVVTKRPDDCIVVTSANPARLKVNWTPSRAGRWKMSLRYRYTDDFHVKDTNRLLCDSPLGSGPVEVLP
ncbi:MAG: hypothetical protein ABFE16_00435 [Armatimonadia bacterium]